jgi:hypothetical protein
MKPGPHELAQQHPQKGVAIYLVMHQMTSCPREVGSRTINQLALTFGTLLSSQSTGAHPWKSLDRLRGNLIYVTGWARQLQIVSALPFPTPTETHASPRPLSRTCLPGFAPGPSNCLKPSGPAAVRFPSGHGRSYVVIAARVKLAGQAGFR